MGDSLRGDREAGTQRDPRRHHRGKALLEVGPDDGGQRSEGEGGTMAYPPSESTCPLTDGGGLSASQSAGLPSPPGGLFPSGHQCRFPSHLLSPAGAPGRCSAILTVPCGAMVAVS